MCSCLSGFIFLCNSFPFYTLRSGLGSGFSLGLWFCLYLSRLMESSITSDDFWFTSFKHQFFPVDNFFSIPFPFQSSFFNINLQFKREICIKMLFLEYLTIFKPSLGIHIGWYSLRDKSQRHHQRVEDQSCTMLSGTAVVFIRFLWNEVASPIINHFWIQPIALLIDQFPTKAEEFNLFYYLTHSCRGRDVLIPFQKLFAWKWMLWTWLEFELSSLIFCFELLIITLTSHLHSYQIIWTCVGRSEKEIVQLLHSLLPLGKVGIYLFVVPALGYIAGQTGLLLLLGNQSWRRTLNLKPVYKPDKMPAIRPLERL